MIARRHFCTLLFFFPIWLGGLSGCQALQLDRSRRFQPLVHAPWKSKNLIIVLGMRTERSGDRVVLPQAALPRVVEAARLYRECKGAVSSTASCVLLASGGDPAGNGIAEADVIRRELIALNVPSENILTETQSVSTLHNAKYSRVIIDREGPDFIVLVTTEGHMERALKMFRFFGLSPIPAPAS